jgi:glycosyltransferase 2 family protein
MYFFKGNNGRLDLRKWIAPALGNLVSLVCLIWVYRGFDWRQELPRLAALDWHWLGVAVIADVSVYISQGWRWRMLLKPVGDVSLVRSVQAIYVGLFTNEVLPLRGGELVRSYLQAHWSAIPFSVVLSSAVVERIFDGAWLVLFTIVSTSIVPLPHYLVDGTRVLAGALAGLAFLLAVAMFQKHHAHAAVAKSRWAEKLWHVVNALHDMGRSPCFYLAFLASFAYLGLQLIPIHALMLGYGLDLSWRATLVTLVILRLGTLLPQAPGNVGSFQFFAVVALQLFGVEKSQATGFATLLFFVVTVPLWVVGFIATLASGLGFGDIRRRAADSHRQIGTPPAAA